MSNAYLRLHHREHLSSNMIADVIARPAGSLSDFPFQVSYYSVRESEAHSKIVTVNSARHTRQL